MLPRMMARIMARRGSLRLLLSAMVLSALGGAESKAQAVLAEQFITLPEAIDKALVNNRQLQIERINPEIARLTLRAAYGFYDPTFTTQARRESASDTGGFDPANFSADAVFEADSEIVSAGLMGVLPTGLTYTLGGNYAHSYGTRNFLNFDSYKTTAGITLSQPLLRDFWVDQPRWLIQVNKRNLEISELGVLFIAMNVINLTQQGYYDLLFAWENMRVYQNLVETRRTFREGIQRQVQLGMVTALEERFARSQLALAETELVNASNTVALASNNLKTLMGVAASEWRDQALTPAGYLLTVPELLDMPMSWRAGLRQRPDLHQLAINLENAALTVRYRRNQLFPSLNVIGSYGLQGADAIQAFPTEDPQASRSRAFQQLEDQDSPSSMIGVLFSIPLTSTAERANYKMSKELRQQAELLLKQKEELILREIADAVNLARFSFERAETAREAVHYAAEALKAEEERLRGGTGSFFLVLQAQEDSTLAKITELAAKRDYNKALSQLHFTEGSLLDRYGLEFDFE